MEINDSFQNEFWYHVATQNEIPISWDTENKKFDISNLIWFIRWFDFTQIDYLLNSIKSDWDLIDMLRTLVWVSDKRMYLELSYIGSKILKNNSTYENIYGWSIYSVDKHPISFYKQCIKSKDQIISNATTKIICDYLLEKWIVDVIKWFQSLSDEDIILIINNLIFTKETQQAEAKRRWHWAEFEIAKFLHGLWVQIIPENKHEKPIWHRDPNVDKTNFLLAQKSHNTWSFDMVAIKEWLPFILIQSLIHTSDPWQYWVNKSDETVLIKNDIDTFNTKNHTRKVYLWWIVDGVWFCENKKDTIDKMIHEFDCFIQIKSIYKAALRLHQLWIISVKWIELDSNFYTQEDAQGMFNKYWSDDIQYGYGYNSLQNTSEYNKLQWGMWIIYF